MKATPHRTIPFAALSILLLGLVLVLATRASEPADAAESYPGQGFLPDNRAWEMVSPPDKNGGEVMPYAAGTKAAADCSSDCGVSFSSLTGFADVAGFSGPHTQYLALRTGEPATQGWSTHGITPPQDPPSVNNITTRMGFLGNFSDDLSRGVFRALSPVATPDDPHPNVEDMRNSYVRTDLKSSGPGIYRLLTDSAVQQTFNGGLGPIHGPTNASLSTVTFETSRQLADASAPGHKLYSWAHDEVRVINEVPSSSDARCGAGAPACISEPSSAIAGAEGGALGANPPLFGQVPYPLSAQRLISADGSRTFFRAPVGTLDAAAGKPVAASRLYVLDDAGTADPSDDLTTRIQQSEKSTPEASQSATFWYATEDGLEAFFSTSEGLVDGDDNGSEDLYRYTDSDDPANDANLTRVSIDTEGPDDPSVTNVIQVSPDGEHVYFVATGALVPGQSPVSPSNPGIYLWHDGEVRFLGEFGNAVDVQSNTPRAVPSSSGFLSSRVSDDGDLLFRTRTPSRVRGLENVQDGRDTLVVYSPDTDSAQCASCKPSGAAHESSASIDVVVDDGGAVSNDTHLPHAISADGRFVFFSSTDALVPEDTNGPCPNLNNNGTPCADAYVYDTQTGRPSLLSSGSDTSGSYFLDASDDGSDVFIATRERLSAWDTDNAYDIYDARIGGGFPEPVDEQACSGAEECRGASPGSPADDNPGSGDFEGEGNANGAPPPDCTNRQNKLDKAEKKLKKSKKKLKKAKRKNNKKATKKAKRAKKRAKSKVQKAERKLEHCRGGNS